ncbi:bifunctional 3'-5' exonuclease/DNA polymerase [Streptacidiphilus carbonis]|uniref:bifunctional 3'-5' exonuclease/DNA polymerase n=1 Tax=Streptacidiphilus carbonis TaxID=105422 RepID=UPI0005AA75AE|nr:bifunctional 3'-5' exonuclease/DNA polymerase [Streptacidiphilus carbonis]
MAAQRVAVAAEQDGPGGRLQPLDESGTPLDGPVRVPDLAAAMAEREAAESPRWVWAATDEVYGRLLPRLAERQPAKNRLARCHDLKLVEPLLLGLEDRYGQPRSLGAAWARLHGLPVPADLPEGPAATDSDQDSLFAPDRSLLPPGTDPLEALVAVHAEQQRRIAASAEPGRTRLLCAAESAGGLVAAEMGFDGLPWSARVHDDLLYDLLGPRPRGGAQPAKLAALAHDLQEALGGKPLNPDSPSQVLRAFAEQGVSLTTTRNWELRNVDHPAAPLLLRYKELSRIHAAHGWAWRDTWARDGRFRPEYVVGGVVSGRWASRGGGALQIPRILRGAVVADPGWRLVVADAGQLEPRVLAAMSNDPGMIRAGAAGDLYAGLAAEAFKGDRARAKLGLLGAMYGQTTGETGQLVAVLRRRFPQAMGLVEAAARTGEAGGVVRSQLGRVCPPPSAGWLDQTAGAFTTDEGDLDGTGTAAGGNAARDARSRGRFTRNFVIQASAADWALALIAGLRRRLAAIPVDVPGDRPRLVFFQHDEVIVHTPAQLADAVRAAVAESGEEARRLVFGATPVRFPLDTHVAVSYLDAKGGSDDDSDEED